MVIAFGWSIGDLLAAITILYKASKALSDLNGAPQEYREAAKLTALIQLDLRSLTNAIHRYEKDRTDLLLDDVQSSTISDDAADDREEVFWALKGLVEKLCDRIRKEMPMEEASREGNKTRWKWTKDQAAKLKWHFVTEKEVFDLIRRTREYSQLATSIYSTMIIDYSRVNTSGLSRIEVKVNQILNHIVRLESHGTDKTAAGALLSSGPQEGLPPGSVLPSADMTRFAKEAILSHLKQFEPETMNQQMLVRARTLCTKYQVRNAIKGWLARETPPILWLQGEAASIVSAIVCNVALDKHSKVAVFACRCFDQSGPLTTEARLLKMVYSVIFQVVNLLPDEASLILPGTGSFNDLQFSMDSLPLALETLQYFLSLDPEVLCIIDGVQYLTQGMDLQLEQFLLQFLNLSSTDTNGAEIGRLLLTTRGMVGVLGKLDPENLNKLDVTRHMNRGSVPLSSELKKMEYW